VVAALVAGLLPALHAARSDPDGELRGGARGGETPHLSRLSRGLVVAEVASTVVVLVVSGLMVRGASTIRVEDATREPASILVAAYTLPAERPADARGRLLFHRSLAEAIEARAGVEGVALMGFLPGAPAPRQPLEIVDAIDPSTPQDSHMIRISPGTLDALGVHLLRGRDLTWRDGDEEPPAVIVNEAFVRRWLPEGDPLGRRVRLLPPAVDDTVEAVVVGIAPPLGIVDRAEGRGDAVYFAAAVSPSRGAHLLVRARAGVEPWSLLPRVREEVAELDPDRPLYEVATLADHQRGERMTEWFFAGFFTTFGLAGLLMASAGLYAVIAFSVGRRRREVGIRAALGAGPRRVLWAVSRGAAFQLALGLVFGLGLAVVLAPAFGDALLGSDPRDPAVYGLIILTIGATGLVAAAVPAQRALRVNPAEALQAE
jgi:predicted permease